MPKIILFVDVQKSSLALDDLPTFLFTVIHQADNRAQDQIKGT